MTTLRLLRAAALAYLTLTTTASCALLTRACRVPAACTQAEQDRIDRDAELGSELAYALGHMLVTALTSGDRSGRVAPFHAYTAPPICQRRWASGECIDK